MLHTAPLDLTPQESEQLSEYVSDDAYVQKQKKDIKELTELFKGMMEGTDSSDAKIERSNRFKISFYL